MFSDTRAERGEHVGLRLDPRGCHLFSAGSRGSGAAGLSQPPSGAGACHGLNDAGHGLNDAGHGLNCGGHGLNGAVTSATGRPGSSRCLTLDQTMRDA